jgi:hypothetical protein
VAPSLDLAISDTLMSKEPVDVSPLYKQVTGYIISDDPSDPLNLGPAGELFPVLRWSSRIKACGLKDDKLVFDSVETFTIQFAPGLKFETRDLAIYGGLNPGPAEDALYSAFERTASGGCGGCSAHRSTNSARLS